MRFSALYVRSRCRCSFGALYVNSVDEVLVHCVLGMCMGEVFRGMYVWSTCR